MRVVIVGGIAAGMSAASKLQRTDSSAEIVVYEKNDYISFGACGLPYFVGDMFEEKERMLVRTPQQMRDKGIDVRTRHEVVSVDAKKKEILVKNLTTGEEFVDHYDRLMAASGASAVKPAIKGMELKNVHHLHSLEDGLKWKELLKNEDVKRVGIVGAGFIGLEACDVIHHLGKEVVLFQRQDRILNRTFDAEITDLLEQELKNAGVDLRLNSDVIAFEGDEKVQAVVTKDERIPVDLVLVATGVRPNTQYLAQTGIECLGNGAIIIDEEGRTSIEDIYAAGDCATVLHQLRTSPAYLPLATNANKLGRIVGDNLGGKHIAFPGTLGSACLKLLSMEAGRTGLSEAEAKLEQISYKTSFVIDKNHTDYCPGQEKIYVKLIYDAQTHVILGGQVAGKSDAVMRTNVIAAAIQAKMTTEQLGMLDLCYAPPFSRTWDVLNVAGNVSK